MSAGHSKRAKTLVAMCGTRSPTSSEVSTASSCFTMSPTPSWWDAVFEATDIPVAINNHCDQRRLTSAKRQLFPSPLKDNGSTVQSCNAAVDSSSLSRLPPLNEPSDDQTVDSVQELPAVAAEIYEAGSQGIEKNDALQEDKKLYPSQKKILTAKVALNAGQEHVSTRGKLKKARVLKPPCMEKCKRCEKPKLTLSERLEINTNFWNLQDHGKQWKFINESIKCLAPKTKSCVPGAKGEKLCSRVYSFTVSNVRKTVCKTMFKNTLHICDSWIVSALSHVAQGKEMCDKRGKTKSRQLKLCIKLQN